MSGIGVLLILAGIGLVILTVTGTTGQFFSGLFAK